MPRFLAPNNLKPFVSEELERALTPLVFKGKGRINYGFKAEILPEICNVYLDARTAGILKRALGPAPYQSPPVFPAFCH